MNGEIELAGGRPNVKINLDLASDCVVYLHNSNQTHGMVPYFFLFRQRRKVRAPFLNGRDFTRSLIH